MLSHIEEDETLLNAICFLKKQRFLCVEESTGTTVMYGGVKILTKLLNMSVIHQRSMCGAL
jgi:hypothetical protein